MYGEATYGKLLWGANFAAIAALAEVADTASSVQTGSTFDARIQVVAAVSSSATAGPPDSGVAVTWDDTLLWDDNAIWTETNGWVAIAHALGSHTGAAQAAAAAGLTSVFSQAAHTSSANAASTFATASIATAADTSSSASASAAQQAAASAFGLLTSSASAAETSFSTQGPTGVILDDITADDLSTGLAQQLAALAEAVEAADVFAVEAGNVASFASSASASGVSDATSAQYAFHAAGVLAASVQETDQSLSTDTASSNARGNDVVLGLASALGALSESAKAADIFSTIFEVQSDWAANADAFSTFASARHTAALISETALGAEAYDAWVAVAIPAADFIMYSRPRLIVLTGRTKAA